MKLGKKDPEGNYIIITDKNAAEKIMKEKGIQYEIIGRKVIIKTKSRSKAEKIQRKLREK